MQNNYDYIKSLVFTPEFLELLEEYEITKSSAVSKFNLIYNNHDILLNHIDSIGNLIIHLSLNVSALHDEAIASLNNPASELVTSVPEIGTYIARETHRAIDKYIKDNFPDEYVSDRPVYYDNDYYDEESNAQKDKRNIRTRY